MNDPASRNGGGSVPRRVCRISGESFALNLDPTIHVELLNYEALARIMEVGARDAFPQGIVGDESSRCKGATSQRTTAMQRLTDMCVRRMAMKVM